MLINKNNSEGKSKKAEEKKIKPDKKAKKETKPKKDPKPKKEKKPKRGLKYLGGILLTKMALGGAQELSYNADEVNKLNVFPVPDGDTGDNMKLTIESGIAAIENMRSNDLGEVMKVLSRGMLLGARGNSGVILSQFFSGMARGLETSAKADPWTLGAALEMGVRQAYTSVMTPTEGTILTVAREAVEFAVKNTTDNSTIRTFFADLAAEMHASLQRTPDLLPQLKEAGVVDSGGAGLLHIIDGFNRVLNGERLKKKPQDKAADKLDTKKDEGAPDIFAFGPDSEMTYGYCTEFLLRLQSKKTDIDNFDLDALKKFLVKNGDSVVAFRTDSIVKVHVHTFAPEVVLGHCRKFGEFLTVKIENMSVQHTSPEEEKKTEEPIAPTPAKERKKYATVAVASGEGIKNLFHEFGVDAVIEGGQTHNPSTSEFLDAFSTLNAEHIFVFPNNGNILMAAEQAAEIYEDAKVYVIPTKSIGTGYVGISSMDTQNPDPDAVQLMINEAVGRVACGLISPSIRDADMNGLHIKCGDIIGIIGKEIVVANEELNAAAEELVGLLLSSPEKFMLTVFRGKDCPEELELKLRARLGELYPEHEMYFIDAGQDIYPYIFVAE